MAEPQISSELVEAERGRDGERPGAGATGRLLGSPFRLLSTLRRARGFHPDGVVFHGELRTYAAGVFGVHAERHQVTARFSKAVGAPGAVPDVLGLALRVHDPERPWDLTLVSAGTTPLGRMVFRPALGWSRTEFSSLAPYRTDDGLRWLTARFEGDHPGLRPSLRGLARELEPGPIEMALRSVGLTGAFQPAAWIRLAEAHADAPHTAFDPMMFTPPRMRLYPGWLSTVREAAYDSSRAGRADGET